jgi:hypothetical protein
MAGAWTVEVKNAELDAFAASAAWVSLHTADPGGTGASESTTARVAVTWSPSTGGVLQSSAFTFTSVPAGSYSYLGFWTLSAGGVYKAKMQLPGTITLTSPWGSAHLVGRVGPQLSPIRVTGHRHGVPPTIRATASNFAAATTVNVTIPGVSETRGPDGPVRVRDDNPDGAYRVGRPKPQVDRRRHRVPRDRVRDRVQTPGPPSR